MDVDDVRTRQKRTAIINRIHNLNTDKACIQETQDAITAKTQKNEYIIYQGKETDTCKDAQNAISNTTPEHQKKESERGMAITIKENIDQYIAKVEHHNERIMTMRIETKIQGKTLIINSHAPDMRSAVATRKEYRGRIKQIPRPIKRKDIVIWATDNNGQVSRNTENENKTTGKWTKAKENSKGNGEN